VSRRGWQIAFAVACVVNVAVLYSPQAGGSDIPYADKVVHVLLFAAVAFTGCRIGLPLRWLVAVLVLNAVTSELVQHFWLPERSGDVFDVVADVTGVALGAWLATGWRARSPDRSA
jgi:VanZ family protein